MGADGMGGAHRTAEADGDSELPPILDTLLDVFYRYDPYGIAWIDPSGPLWYEKMAIEIVRGLPFARSVSETGEIVLHELEEFSFGWGGTRLRRHRGDRFDEMIAEVWQAWHSRGSVNE